MKLPPEVIADSREALSLNRARSAFERGYLTRLLRSTGGNITHAARLAERNRTDFYRLLHRHTLDPQRFKKAGQYS